MNELQGISEQSHYYLLCIAHLGLSLSLPAAGKPFPCSKQGKKRKKSNETKNIKSLNCCKKSIKRCFPKQRYIQCCYYLHLFLFLFFLNNRPAASPSLKHTLRQRVLILLCQVLDFCVKVVSSPLNIFYLNPRNTAQVSLPTCSTHQLASTTEFLPNMLTESAVPQG